MTDDRPDAGLPAMFVEIHDAYYEDPDAVRHFATHCEFVKPFTGTWQGLQSLQRHPDTRKHFELLRSRLPVRGVSSWENVETSYRFWGRPSAGMFAVLNEGQLDNVHFHRRSGAWAAVCYLAPEKECDGRQGVRFFRHKQTGIESIEGLGPEELATLRADAFNESAWDEVRSVPMEYNRLVLFDGRYLHAASPGFGEDPSHGRLTQLFNIDIL